MSKIKIRKGDTIEVIAGRKQDRGKRGEVIKVMPKVNRVVVQSLNMRKRHQKQVQVEGRNIDTGIIEFEGPIPVPNVMVVCPSCNQPSRLGINRDEDGMAHRYCKACDAELD